MHPSLRLAYTRQPLIRFLGKRQWPTRPEEQHPHPFAPTELKEHFSDFLKKFESTPAVPSSASASTSPTKKAAGSGQVFEEFWQAPAKLWKRDLEEWEIDLVQSGGATRH